MTTNRIPNNRKGRSARGYPQKTLRLARYKHIAMPAPDVTRPINPKNCSDLVKDVRQNFTVIRSSNTRTVREIPYFDCP
jgi:hypothetical protein